MMGLLFVFTALCAAFTLVSDEGRWVRGNTHTHTTESDGDSPPEAVAEWYKSHGYNFLVLSDHNTLTDTAKHQSVQTDDFILIPGEEVCIWSYGKHVHMTAIDIRETIHPREGKSLADTIQQNVNLINNGKGLAQINHPNFVWAFDHRELSQVQGYSLMEVFNGHPDVNNQGSPAHIPVEQVWDILLSQGKDVYAVASDDAHHLLDFSSNHANPGRGWIYVKVNELTQSEVIDNIRKGNFYASVGVELEDYSAEDGKIIVKVKTEEGANYRIRFIAGSMVRYSGRMKARRPYTS